MGFDGHMSDQTATGGQITVLVVDDHAMVAHALAELLDLEPDITVVGRVATLDEARQWAARTLPQVVLMDYRLSGQNGIDATRAVRKVAPQAQVIMLTSVHSDALVQAALEAGCAGYLTKDRPVEEMLSVVRAAARGETLIPSSMLRTLLPAARLPAAAVGRLTKRELEVLALLAEGLSNRAIADRLVLSEKTIRNHANAVLMKLGAHSRLEAVAIASRQGLIELG